MKRTVVMLRPYGAASSLLLVLSLFVLAGCSGGNAVGNAAGNAVGKYDLKPSEIVALKKASKGPWGLQKALMKREIEQLKEQGVVVKTAPPGKMTNRSR